MPSKIAIALLLLGNAPLFCAFGETGEELLLREIPALHRAITKIAGERANEYMNSWNEKDVRFFRSKHEGLLSSSFGENTIQSKYVSHGAHIVGTLAEIHGNGAMRKLAEQRDTYVFLDEVTYELINRPGNRPDGILYEIAGDRLILHQVMESKLTSIYNREQASLYLALWKDHGITVGDVDHHRLFGPEEISVNLSGRIVSLADLDSEDLERATTLVSSSQDLLFKGTYEPTSFSASEAWKMAYQLVEEASGQPMTPHQPRRFRALTSEDEIEMFRIQITDWLLDNRAWPRSSGTEGLEYYLAKQVGNRAGQAGVFVNDLDNYTRHFLVSYGKSPAQMSLQTHLLRLTPSHSNAVSVLRAYLRKYERRKTDPEIVRLLTRTSKEWGSFFASNPITHFRVADLGEFEQCMEILEQRSRRRTGLNPHY